MKVTKIIIAFIVVILIISSVSCVFADVDPEAFKPKYTTVQKNGGAMELARKIVGTVNAVSAVVLVVTIAVLGMKYITASVEERANYKKTMGPIAIGTVLLVGTASIINLILNIVPNEIS